MEKLTIKELASYLPYGLKAKLSNEGIFNLDSEYPNENAYKIGTINDIYILNGEISGVLKINNKYSFDFESLSEIDLILRPLSDLTKEIEVNGDKFVPTDLIEKLNPHNENIKHCVAMDNGYIEMFYYNEYQILLSLHFDIFNLIERGLAIDINTIQQ